MINQLKRDIILDRLSPFQPTQVSVFGSYARGDNKEGSDLDILVEFGYPINLLELIGLEQELSKILGVKVDLVTTGAVSPYIKPYIEKDIKKIL